MPALIRDYSDEASGRKWITPYNGSKPGDDISGNRYH